MKFPFRIWLLFAAALLAAADAPRSVTTTLTEVRDDLGVVEAPSLPVGVSGIVIHAYDQTHKAIVASAAVTKSDEEGTRIKLLPYRGLYNPNLPTVKTRPQKGDTVILGYLYDRVLPVVPNRKSFEKARESFPNLHLIHPDLFAAELAKEKSPLPEKEHFQTFCEKMHLGIVMFMFKDGTDFLDCVSWVKVAHADVAAVDPEEVKEPFYNRFESIPAPFYQWAEPTIGNFDRYYKKLEKKR